MEASARTVTTVHASEKCEEDGVYVNVHGAMGVLITDLGIACSKRSQRPFEFERPTCTRKNSNMILFEETYRMREMQHENERTYTYIYICQ
jgi:hypothetical protein